MANAVFTTKVNPVYDDLPESHYHFPKTYLRQAEAAVGDWIVYYEPRRHDSSPSGTEGRQCYFATARVTSVDADPKLDGHYYAFVADYVEFPRPVPFREGQTYYESGLKKGDGSANKGAFGRAVRLLQGSEYLNIVQSAFSRTIEAVSTAEEVQPEYRHPVVQQVVNRKIRDAAFAQMIRDAYDSTCALTGLKLVNGGSRCEIEAVHIRPVSADGPDSVRNGLALSRTFHWMFDRGIISLEDDGRIIMAQRLVPDQVKRMLSPDGYARLPHIPQYQPHRQFLRYHREKVFKG